MPDLNFRNYEVREEMKNVVRYWIFLGNHDEYQDRLGSLYSGDYKKINLASAISLLRPCVPFIYYGQELGQKNLLVQGDLRLRGKFNWILKDTQENEITSPLALNKALLNFRNQNTDLFSSGKLKLLSSNSPKIASYTISTENKEILCVFNMSSTTTKNIELSNYQNDQPTFSCLIGDSSSTITASEGKIKIDKIAPYSVRVYSTKGIEEKNIFTDEDYNYTSSDKIPDNVFIPEKMYIRGNFNDWDGDLMEKTEDNTEAIKWEIDITFYSSGNIQYKFCENNSKDWGSNWGDSNSSDPNHNIIKTVTNGKKYRFSISISKKTGEVTTGFSCVN